MKLKKKKGGGNAVSKVDDTSGRGLDRHVPRSRGSSQAVRRSRRTTAGEYPANWTWTASRAWGIETMETRVRKGPRKGVVIWVVGQPLRYQRAGRLLRWKPF